MPKKPRKGAARAGALSALALVSLFALAACSRESAAAIFPEADLEPPGLLAAGPEGARSLRLRFDEAIKPIEGSFALEPQDAFACAAVGEDLVATFAADQEPGCDYALAGEVEDQHGNRTRFLVRFVGWNDRAPPMRLSELQTGKNASISNSHRDYLELEAMADGNLGGEELSWASSVKSASYRFPAIEVKKGDFVVLHLAPEGIASEKDETGSDLSLSGGVDASASGRDLWFADLALPDENGAVALRLRAGAPPIDAVFYAALAKSGPMGEDRLSELVASLAGSGAWPFAGSQPVWEDACRWKFSSARSLCRSAAPDAGPASWYVTAAGGQSPGSANSPPEAGMAAAARGAGARKAAVAAKP
jgi:hypothetical protein